MDFDIDRIEDLMLQTAEADQAAGRDLTALLREQSEKSLAAGSPEMRARWQAAVELVCEAITEAQAQQATDLLLELARLGGESVVLRDSMDRQARTEFAEYPDPAGLLHALGIRHPETSVQDIPQRWRVFAALQEGQLCCHPHHGQGAVLEVDGLSNEVRVLFDRTLVFPLERFLADFHLLHQRSLLGELFRGFLSWAELEQRDFEQVRRELAQSLLPPARSPALFRRCLVNRYVSDRQFDKLFAEEKQERSDQAVGSLAAERRLDSCRSLEELRAVVESEAAVLPLTDDDIANVERLLLASHERTELADLWANTVLRLWERTDREAWLRPWIRQRGGEAVCWRQPKKFSAVVESLPAKRLPAWFELTHQAVGPERLAELGLTLHLGAMPAADSVLAEATGDADFFSRIVARKLESGRISADLTVWLWQHGEEPEKETIRHPERVFRALATPLGGVYVRAHRSLRSLLLQNQDFQRFLMQDGDPVAIDRMVAAIRRHSDTMDGGEQQSLLVRLARLFPQVREAIEKKPRRQRRGSAPAAGASQPITSIRSFEERKRELRSIIQEKIPANSRTIAQARSYGDLRENAEYKAAKEEQGLLLSRRQQLEEQLEQVRPSDFADITAPRQVVPGCTVALQWQGNKEEGEVQQYHVLGCWDSDPYRNIISCDTPLGRALLGKKPGQSADTPTGPVEIHAVLPLDKALRQWATETEQRA